jgi:hypothetical protein
MRETCSYVGGSCARQVDDYLVSYYGLVISIHPFGVPTPLIGQSLEE